MLPLVCLRFSLAALYVARFNLLLRSGGTHPDRAPWTLPTSCSVFSRCPGPRSLSSAPPAIYDPTRNTLVYTIDRLFPIVDLPHVSRGLDRPPSLRVQLLVDHRPQEILVDPPLPSERLTDLNNNTLPPISP